VRWKDLCLDAVDVGTQSAFWASVIGLGAEAEGEPRRLTGATPEQQVWVNPVDRPHVVKNRVHLDVDCASVDDLVGLGARVVAPAAETGLGWTLVVDPEGNEFCAFTRDPAQLPAYRLHGIGLDCVDAPALATWWGDLLGTTPRTWLGEDFVTLEGVAADERMTLDFAPVPEPRTVPNRVHWDVWGEVEEVLAAGATRLWEGRAWTALADPEGNEFCVFAPRS